jgi:hypothetical protein
LAKAERRVSHYVAYLYVITEAPGHSILETCATLGLPRRPWTTSVPARISSASLGGEAVRLPTPFPPFHRQYYPQVNLHFIFLKFTSTIPKTYDGFSTTTPTSYTTLTTQYSLQLRSTWAPKLFRSSTRIAQTTLLGGAISTAAAPTTINWVVTSFFLASSESSSFPLAPTSSFPRALCPMAIHPFSLASNAFLSPSIVVAGYFVGCSAAFDR